MIQGFTNATSRWHAFPRAPRVAAHLATLCTRWDRRSLQPRAPYEVAFVNPWIIQVQEELSSAWRFRWLALAVAAALALVGWLVVFALPDRYEAVASVFVDTRTSLKPVLQGLTVE